MQVSWSLGGGGQPVSYIEHRGVEGPPPHLLAIDAEEPGDGRARKQQGWPVLKRTVSREEHRSILDSCGEAMHRLERQFNIKPGSSLASLQHTRITS